MTFLLYAPFLVTAILAVFFHFEFKRWLKLSETSFSHPNRVTALYALTLVFTAALTHLALRLAPIETICFTVFAGLVIGAIIVDLVTGYLPNTFTYSLVVFGLLANLLGKFDLSFQYFINPLPAVWGVCVGYGILLIANVIHIIFTKKDGVGMGDARLLAGFGAWFGAPPLVLILGIASFFSLWIPLYAQYIKKEPAKERPFGPYLGLAAVPYIFFIHYFLT